MDPSITNVGEQPLPLQEQQRSQKLLAVLRLLQSTHDVAEAHVIDTHFVQASEDGGKVIALKAS